MTVDSRTSGPGRGKVYAAVAGRLGPAAAIAFLVAAACIDTTAPFSPQCSPVMGIDLAGETIETGDTFTATATHPGDGCLSNLQWTAEGPITFRAAEGVSATFRADDSGFATIRVQNDKGSFGVLEIEVEEGEEEG